MKNGEILKQELRNRGLMFKFVSKKTGIKYDSLWNYLNGKSEMPEPLIRCVALTFGIDLKIFGFNDENIHQFKEASHG